MRTWKAVPYCLFHFRVHLSQNTCWSFLLFQKKKQDNKRYSLFLFSVYLFICCVQQLKPRKCVYQWSNNAKEKKCIFEEKNALRFLFPVLSLFYVQGETRGWTWVSEKTWESSLLLHSKADLCNCNGNKKREWCCANIYAMDHWIPSGPLCVPLLLARLFSQRFVSTIFSCLRLFIASSHVVIKHLIQRQFIFTQGCIF